MINTKTSRLLAILFAFVCTHGFAATAEPNTAVKQTGQTNSTLHSIAFYYGYPIPTDELHAFDAVVVAPEHDFDPNTFRTAQSEPYAYVSVGEIEPKQATKLPKEWLVGENKAWHSFVVDQTNPQWRQYFIDKIITPLWQRGYRSFFLDTLDSFQLAAHTDKAKKAQIAGLITLLQEVKQRYPEAKLIFNRGFEILPKLHNLATAVAAESLYAGWDQANGRYVPVSDSDREYLLKELAYVKSLGLPVISIDYVAPKNRNQARQIAEKIKAHGFIPWVSDKELRSLGVSTVEVIPRKVFMIYDLQEDDPYASYSEAFRLGAMPLQHMGLVPEFHHVRDPLPHRIMHGEYAGIVVWLASNNVVNKKLHQWLLDRMQEGSRVVFISHFGFPMSTQNLAPFHLSIKEDYLTKAPVSITTQDKDILGFEIALNANAYEFIALAVQQGTPLLTLTDAANTPGVMTALTEWGGYALSPYVIVTLPNNQVRWLLNPFKFFQASLKLPHIPVPDTTTDNGRRIMLVHVDGDAFNSRAEWYPNDFAGHVMAKEVFEKYRIPTTVSIVQAELDTTGQTAKHSPELIHVAQHIFQYPWVEVAHHTYSHPYKWYAIENTPGYTQGKEYNIDIPGYTFDLKKEIIGTTQFVNSKLTNNKKPCKIILWSGDTEPSAKALKMSNNIKLRNFNGGNTIITNSNSSITNISPLGTQKNGQFQVYAPIQNENVYTNLWTGPYYGYERVIETFKLTDEPTRYKPIDIYYHFYSATKHASLSALHKVYQWALSQPVHNLYVSDFTDKILDFNHLVLAKDADKLLIRNNGKLRELRMSKTQGYPDLQHSDNVIGFNSHGQARYIHLGPAQQTRLHLQKTAPTLPYLVSANGMVTFVARAENEFKLKLAGYMPLQFELHNTAGCTLYRHGQVISNPPANQEKVVLVEKDSDEINLRCP